MLSLHSCSKSKTTNHIENQDSCHGLPQRFSRAFLFCPKFKNQQNNRKNQNKNPPQIGQSGHLIFINQCLPISSGQNSGHIFLDVKHSFSYPACIAGNIKGTGISSKYRKNLVNPECHYRRFYKSGQTNQLDCSWLFPSGTSSKSGKYKQIQIIKDCKQKQHPFLSCQIPVRRRKPHLGIPNKIQPTPHKIACHSM